MSRLISIFALALGLSSAALAQQNQNPISYDALAKAKNGQWAEYTMSMKGQPQQIKMRYSLVEKSDKVVGLEVNSDTPMGPVVMHMQFTPGAAETWNMSKAVVSYNGQKKFMTAQEMKTGDIKKSDTPGKLVGTETVTVPVGKFEAKHYQRKTTMPGAPGEQTIDVWMSDKALPTGLVKMAASNGVEAVLSSSGADAKSQLSLEPTAADKAAEKSTGGDKSPSQKPAKP